MSSFQNSGQSIFNTTDLISDESTNPLALQIEQPQKSESALETKSTLVSLPVELNVAPPIQEISETVIPVKSSTVNTESASLLGKQTDDWLVGNSEENFGIETSNETPIDQQLRDSIPAALATTIASAANAASVNSNGAIVPSFQPNDLIHPLSNPLSAIPIAIAASPTSEILTVPGLSGTPVTLKFKWTERDAAFNNEVGVFVVDDLGAVNGIAPSDPNYALAALSSSTKQILFSSGQGAGAQTQIQFEAGTKLGFYLIQNNTSANWLSQNPGNALGRGTVAFFSLNQANPDQFDHLKSQLLPDGVVELRWEDLTGGGDRDFDDVVFTIAQPSTAPGDGPALIVPGLSGQQVGTKFVWTFREAAFNNEMGVFYVDDAQGRIGNLLPSDPGYAVAALTRQGSQVIFASGQTAGATTEVDLPSQQYVGFYLIQNSTTAKFLRQNPTNQVGQGPLAFFFFPEANPDGIVHIQNKATNEIGWEDLTGGGDRDFDDLVFRYEFGTPTGGRVEISINDISIVEGDNATQQAQFLVQLSQANKLPVSVNFTTVDDTATAGSDYLATAGTLTFAPGETRKFVTVPIVGDTLSETIERFNIKLSQAINASIRDAEGIGTIQDNDTLPGVTIDNVSLLEGNNGTTTALFTASLSSASGQTVRVDFTTADNTATAGSDYQAVSGTLEFKPGEISKTISVTVNGDILSEPDETFAVNLINPVNATLVKGTGIGTIRNDDSSGLSISDVSIAEGDSGTKLATFTVSLANAITQPVTVNYTTLDGTALAGKDYQATQGTLTFNPGEALTQTVSVTILGDAVTEGDETFSLQLSQPSNAIITDGTGLGTIINDDRSQTIDVTLREGTAFQVAYRQSFTIPTEPSVLKFSFADLAFDTTDLDSIKDAFEARLIDANGNSVVYTLSKAQDTFFNITEGLATQLAPGATLNDQTISLNLAGLTPGSQATLVLQLVNNDGDTTTSVRITNYEIIPAGEAILPTGVVSTATSRSTPTFLSPEAFSQLKLQDVSASFKAEYGRTSFNEDTKVLYTDLAVRNSGTYGVDTPLYMVVERLTDPSVQVLNADGITPEGLPYYDVSRLVGDGNLAPGEASQSKTIAFYNPNGVQFDYQLTFLGQLNQAILTNQAPTFTSTAELDALVGKPYSYDANATDPDNDTLSYSLKVGPQGMQVDSATGMVTWTPTTNDLGTQVVTLLAQDGKGGKAEQTFTVTTRQPLDNRAPVITSAAITTASVSQPYRYDVDAIDPDSDPLTYSLLTAPQGMSIDSASGVITWDTITQAPGNYTVSVQTADGRGGTNTQTFAIGLTNTATGEIRGIKWDDINANGIRDEVSEVIELVNSSSQAYYNNSLGDLYPGNPTDPRAVFFPAPDLDPTTNFPTPPDLSTVSQLGDWLNAPATSLANGFWTKQSIPTTWDLNTETAIIYEIDGGSTGISNVTGNFGVDNGIFVWVNGEYKFGATAPSITSVDEYQVNLGNLKPGKNYIQVLREDHGGVTGYDLKITGSRTSFSEPGLPNVSIYLDLNNNGTFDPNEPSQLTAAGTPNPGNTTTPLTVQGTDVIYLAGRTDVTIPSLGASDPSFSLLRHSYVNPDFIQETKPKSVVVQAGDVFTFAATGSVDFFNGSFQPTGSPDGYAGTSTSNLFNLGGIGAYRGPQGALVGVFLTDENPANGSVTGVIDYSTIGSAFETISPGLGQIFFIGDGLTGRGTGDVQEFIAPNGSTRLFLGIADAFGVSDGPPGFYEDNDGAYQVSINRQTGQQGAGDYRFTNLQPGTYVVREVVPTGYRQTFPGGTTSSTGDGFADVILDYFDSGAGPLAGPYGGDDAGNFPVTVPTNIILGSNTNGFLSLPTGSYVTVGFTNEIIVDGPGNDIFIPETGAAGERAEVYVSSNLRDFVLLGIGNGGDTSLFDLASIGFTEPVRAIKVVGLDNNGASPGFDVVNVQGLPGSIASPDFYTVTLGAGEIADSRNFGNTIVNVGPNRDPSFTSKAPTIAAMGLPFRYDAKAADPDGNSLSYDLLTSPTGMVVDSARGVVIWQPGPDQGGVQDVVLRVRDGQGGSALQSFQITVGENQAPNVTSDPVTFAKLGELYSYQVTGADPEGQPLAFQLINAPQGMTINTQTGLVQWSPTATQTGNFSVTVAVQDPAGAIGRQTFTLTAADNATPVINSTAPTTTTAGLTYRYDVKAVDPDGDTLSYSLINAPQGMSIDALGRLSWVTSIANVGVTPIELRVTDTDGASVSQLFDLTVAPDLQAPKVNVQLSSGTIEIGKTVTFQVSATDNVKVNPDDVTLTVNGSPITLAGGRNATFQPTQAGLYEVVATVEDAAGNLTATAPITLRVIDPKDTNAPEITIISPSSNAQVTTLTDIVGSVTDTDLEFYRVEYAPFRQVDFNNLRLADPDFVTITQNSTVVTNGTLAQFDPTLLLNDDYVIRITAQDVNGNTNTQGLILGVTSNNKLGNFRIELTDLSIPLGGIPITVDRVYDTLQRNQISDFGYGWSLGEQDARIQESVPVSELEQLGIGLFGGNAFSAGTRVYLTNPEGRRVGFTFDPVVVGGSFFGELWAPRFTPDAGVLDTLSDATSNIRLVRASDGTFRYPLFSFLTYNPTDYNLTTKDGLTYRYDQFEGLEEIRDRNGNTVTFTDAGITSSNGASVQFARDPQGRITQVIDSAGSSIQYGYDVKGDLVKVTDRNDNTTQFTYDPQNAHYLSEVIDPLGRTGIRSEYDEQGRLTRIIDANGNPIDLEFTLGETTSTQTITDALGNPTTLVYDDRGNIVREINSLSGVTERTYDVNNNLVSLRDPLGNITSYTYDAIGNLLTVTNPLGQITAYTYNAQNDVLTVTDPLNNTTRNIYDSRGNLITNINSLGKATNYSYNNQGNIQSVTNALNGITQYEYDSQGRVTTIIDARNQRTQMTYDLNGNLLTLTTPLGNTTRFTYDAEGRPLTVTDAQGNVSRVEYDATGNRIATIDALNRRKEFSYDNRGQLTEIRYLDGTRERFTYNVNGQRIGSTDRAGRITTFTYDALGRLVETIYPDSTPSIPTDNPRIKREYDAASRLTGFIDELGNRTEFTYDAAGRQILSRDALGNATTNVYDAAGNLTSITDALNHTTRYVYDALGQITTTRLADGSQVITTYDVLGRVTAETDQAGVTTQYEYDALDRLTAVVDALGQRTEYTYDADGNLISQRDARGNTETYEYDSVSQRIATILPLGQRAETRYDAIGNVIGTTDFNGRTIAYTYNSNNQVIAERFEDGSSVTYTYTPTLERATATDSRGTTTYSYDERDRLISRSEPDGRTIRYFYDDASNRTAVTIPSGTVNYTYDVLNRMATVTDRDGGVTTYTYDAVGNLLQTALPNGTIETRQYNSLNQLVFLEQTGPSGTIASYRYTLSPTGQRLAVEENNGRRVEYTYDGLDRLTQETITDPTNGNRTIAYTYDRVGNRLSRNDSVEGLTTYTYDNNDRLLTETANGQVTEYSYDANGSVVSISLNGNEQTTYNWDDQGRLTSVSTNTPQGIQRLEYQYDADGNRVSIVVNGQELRYLVDTEEDYAQVVEEYTPDGTVQKSYVHGLDLISQTQQGNQSVYHADGLGTVRTLTDENGNVTDQVIYDAFGRLIAELGNTDNSFRFTGEQFDEASDLYYLRARYYDPETGRFISRDSFEGFQDDPQSLHKYTYAHNDPVNLTDPSGNVALSEYAALLGRVASVVGIALSVRDFVLEPTLANLFFLLIDVLDGPTNVGQGLNNARRAADAADAANDARKAADATNDARKAADAADATNDATRNAKRENLERNKAQGRAFEAEARQRFEQSSTGVQEQVTIQTDSGTRIRVDLIGRDKSTGNLRIGEAKSSSNAPLTPNQAKGFPELAREGGTIVGQGKPGFPGGTRIPPTEVEVIRP